jgi:hypothetical protein
MTQVPAADVRFNDPVLQQFFDDERAGLCDIEVKRTSPIASGDSQHHVRVQYHDPELAMLRRLSF